MTQQPFVKKLVSFQVDVDVYKCPKQQTILLHYNKCYYSSHSNVTLQVQKPISSSIRSFHSFQQKNHIQSSSSSSLGEHHKPKHSQRFKSISQQKPHQSANPYQTKNSNQSLSSCSFSELLSSFQFQEWSVWNPAQKTKFLFKLDQATRSRHTNNDNSKRRSGTTTNSTNIEDTERRLIEMIVEDLKKDCFGGIREMMGTENVGGRRNNKNSESRMTGVQQFTVKEQISVLLSLLKLGVLDDQICASVAELISLKRITDVQDLTKVLYVFAKFGFKRMPSDFLVEKQGKTAFIEDAKNILLSPHNHGSLTVVMAARNLWNFYMLDFFDKTLVKTLCAVIKSSNSVTENATQFLKPLDVANTVAALAHFNQDSTTLDSEDYDCLEILLRQSILHAEHMNAQTLAIIVSSFNQMDILNETLLEKTKKVLRSQILNDFDSSSLNDDQESDAAQNIAYKLPLNTLEKVDKVKEQRLRSGGMRGKGLKPVDSAMFLAAFVKAKLFNDLDFLETLEIAFLSKLQEATCADMVTFLSACTTYRNHFLADIIKNNNVPRSHLKIFRSQSEQIYVTVLTQLTQEMENMNIKGIELTIMNGHNIYLSKRKSKQALYDFTIAALNSVYSREDDHHLREDHLNRLSEITRPFFDDKRHRALRELLREKFGVEVQFDSDGGRQIRDQSGILGHSTIAGSSRVDDDMGEESEEWE